MLVCILHSVVKIQSVSENDLVTLPGKQLAANVRGWLMQSFAGRQKY